MMRVIMHELAVKHVLNIGVCGYIEAMLVKPLEVRIELAGQGQRQRRIGDAGTVCIE